MRNKVYISFEFENNGLRDELAHMFKENGGDIEATPAYVKEDVSHLGTCAVKKAVHDAMEDCVIALFVTGENVRSSPWIKHELFCARLRLSIPCFVIASPSGRHEAPEAYRLLNLLPWEPDTIATILNHRLCSSHSRALLRIQKRRRSRKAKEDHSARYRSKLLVATPTLEFWAVLPVKKISSEL